ncbi:MAG: hypothetical protein OXC67_03045 [Flavobacteriaceae bacterium]|nr:hypothetical protein [Flavobacteriaceae bacterium]MCY4299604.1 hypothetical protein [Flavobacteriaceae bacterium]
MKRENRPEINPYDYQHNKSELEEDVRMNTTPKELVSIAFQQVQGFRE